MEMLPAMLPVVPPFPSCSSPPVTLVLPAYVFVPVKISRLGPDFCNPPAPEMTCA